MSKLLLGGQNICWCLLTSGSSQVTWAFWEESSSLHFGFLSLSDQPAGTILESLQSKDLCRWASELFPRDGTGHQVREQLEETHGYLADKGLGC